MKCYQFFKILYIQYLLLCIIIRWETIMGFESSQLNKEQDFRKESQFFFKTVSELRKIN
jgi:hypothetical protein